MSTNSSNLHTVADSIPNNGIDFGCCTICMDATRSFHLANPTSSAVKYEIKNEQGLFEISPTSGKRHNGAILTKYKNTYSLIILADFSFKTAYDDLQVDF